MFYPADSLKRGGRFYLCWVADSWPLRFASITHRQLWSQDIRKICDELIQVMTNESGRPTNRYSLRLSSQLMRGLVRLYQKKVNVFLSDLCMINANVIKHANKKLNVHEILELPHRERPQRQVLELPQVVVPEEPENEIRIEEIIQNSGNVVTNIQDITLKEAAIPDFQLPPNDGFGEENPEQAFQLAADRTMELMMAPNDAATHSGLDLPVFDVTDKSHDRTRLAPRELQMERISGHDVTLLRQSDGEVLLPAGDFEKEIPEISDIPIPIPELSVVQEKEQEPVVGITEVPLEKPIEEPLAVDLTRQSQAIELEELEETEPRAKRRRLRKLIIDKKIKLSPNFLRARIENPRVELRCEDSTDDIVEIKVPYDVFFRRPCRAGFKERSNIALPLTRLFMRNLGVVNKLTRIEREEIEAENIMHRSLRSHTRSALERIEEVDETAQTPQQITEPPPERTSMIRDNLAPPEMDTAKDFGNVSVGQKEQDIADMLTQKLETLSQRGTKRTSELEAEISPKRCRSGYLSFRESQRKMREIEASTVTAMGKQETICITEVEKVPEIPTLDQEGDKENLPANKQTPARVSNKEVERHISVMLQEAGLADIGPVPTDAEPRPTTQTKVSRRHGSEGSETPLGSLDRTKVSLGDSDQTTDSRRFIRDQWGTEGTMIKILEYIKERRTITVKTLVDRGPVVSGYKRLIAAKCFSSILKLKQHGFIKFKKCSKTSELVDVFLGPKFDTMEAA